MRSDLAMQPDTTRELSAARSPFSVTMKSQRLASYSFVLLAVSVSLTYTVPVAQAWPHRAGDVRLDHGVLGSYAWSIGVHRGLGPEGDSHPCLVATSGPATSGSMRPISRLSLCGSLNGSQIVVSNSSGNGADERTVLGLAFGQDVRSVRIWLLGRRSRILRLALLGRSQARKAHVERFRYAALGLAGDFCLRRFTTYDSDGRLMDPGRNMGCHYRVGRLARWHRVDPR